MFDYTYLSIWPKVLEFCLDHNEACVGLQNLGMWCVRSCFRELRTEIHYIHKYALQILNSDNRI